MTITALSTQPNSVTRPTTFNADSDAFHSELPTLVSEINATAAAMTATAAGGAVSLQYTFDSTTTDADPGAGLLRLSSATQNASTVIRADLLGSDTSDYSGVLALLDDSTSTNKGYLTIRHATTPTKWLTFSIASVASPSGYKNITATCVASSAASPFTNGDALLFDFTPTGDAGSLFNGGNLTAAINTARATVASAATTADIWAAAGNQIDWTGTVTCTGFPAAPQAGAERTLITAGAAVFTAGANMLIDGVTSGNLTCAANDTVIVRAVTTTQFKLSRVKYDGTAQVAAAAGFTLGTPVATTSGTSIDYTGIPAGTKVIQIMFAGVSTNGTSDYIIQLGDSGGIVATGYNSLRAKVASTVAVEGGSSDTSFQITQGIAATADVSGIVTLALENSTNFMWTCKAVMNNTGTGTELHIQSGSKALSAVLDRVRITTVGGINTFDAGNVNISYQ